MSRISASQDAVWEGASLERLYTSPLGYRFLYPPIWEVEAQRSTVFISPGSLPFIPFTVLTAQVDESSLSELQQRLLRKIEKDTESKVLSTAEISDPRPAEVIEIIRSLSTGELVHQYYVAELLSDGKLSLLFITADWEVEGRDYAYLLAPWQHSELEEVTIQAGYRRIALEDRKLAFEFPDGWIIHNANDTLVQIRSPARSSIHPNIVMELGTVGPNFSMLQLQQETLELIQNQFDIRSLAQYDTRVGTQDGVAFHYETLNQNQDVDRVLVLLAHSEHVWIRLQLAGMVERWGEYSSRFEHIQRSFVWTGG